MISANSIATHEMVSAMSAFNKPTLWRVLPTDNAVKTKCQDITAEIYKRINITFEIKKLEADVESDGTLEQSDPIDSNDLSNETDLFAYDKSESISSSVSNEDTSRDRCTKIINLNNNEETTSKLRKPTPNIKVKCPKKRFRKRVKKKQYSSKKSDSDCSSDESIPLSRMIGDLKDVSKHGNILQTVQKEGTMDAGTPKEKSLECISELKTITDVIVSNVPIEVKCKSPVVKTPDLVDTLECTKPSTDVQFENADEKAPMVDVENVLTADLVAPIAKDVGIVLTADDIAPMADDVETVINADVAPVVDVGSVINAGVEPMIHDVGVACTPSNDVEELMLMSAVTDKDIPLQLSSEDDSGSSEPMNLALDRKSGIDTDLDSEEGQDDCSGQPSKFLSAATMEPLFHCKLCFFTGDTEAVMFEHVKYHDLSTFEQGLDAPVFRCMQCPFTAENNSSLRRHVMGHRSCNEKRYACSECDRSYTQMSTLRVHARTHRNERPHACELCDKRFTRYDTWKRHQKVHLKPSVADVVEGSDLA